MRINWGIIGCGRLACLRIVPAFAKSRDNRLLAVADNAVSKVCTVAQRYGVERVYTSAEELIRDPDIKAVYIATPAYLHSRQVIVAARAGKHILCEKPMALTVKDCEKMIEVCRQNKVNLMIGNMMRFHPIHQKAKQLIQGGELGKIILARAQMSFYYPPEPDAWRQYLSSGGGGSLMDAGIHAIDILRYILGEEVTAVSAFVDNLAFDYEVEDTAVALLKFTSDAQGIVDACFSIRYTKNVLEVYGTQGTILAADAIRQVPGNVLRVMKDSKVVSYDFVPTDCYLAEIEHFGRCIKEDRPPLVSGEDGLKDVMVVLAAYESAKKGMQVSL